MSRETALFAVFGFESTHQALDAESLLGDLGIDVVPIPVPADLSARCGIALRVPDEQAERALIYLNRGGLAPSVRSAIEDI